MAKKWGGRRRNTIFAALLQRDLIPGKGWRCIVCGRIASDEHQLSVEHKTPRSLGGTDAFSNLALSHRSCNYSRGSRPLEEFQNTIVDRSAWVTGLRQ